MANKKKTQDENPAITKDTEKLEQKVEKDKDKKKYYILDNEKESSETKTKNNPKTDDLISPIENCLDDTELAVMCYYSSVVSKVTKKLNLDIPDDYISVLLLLKRYKPNADVLGMILTDISEMIEDDIDDTTTTKA